MNHKLHDSLTADYISLIFDSFMELHGDRKSGDDSAVLGGLARLGKYRVVVVGYQKYRSEDPPKPPGPDGYRKSLRLMQLSETFGNPVVMIIDIPETHPVPMPQQQQINEAIARCLEKVSRLKTPVIAIITGKSNSFLALDMIAADRVLMLENAVCSTSSLKITDNSSIANSLSLKARNLLDMDMVHRIVNCPSEDDIESTARELREVILDELNQITQIYPEVLLQQRLDKFQSQFRNFKSLNSLINSINT